jgi:O-antigen ligase
MLLCCFAFILAASPMIASIVIVPLFILTIIYKIRAKIVFRFSSFMMLYLMIFYLLHVSGLLYTENVQYAALDLQIKASFLLMPFFLDNLPITTSDFRKICRAFITGCTLYSLVLLLNAFLEYRIWKNSDSFFYTDFSARQHVAYLTLYINISLFFLIDEWFGKPGSRITNKIILLSWFVFLIAIIILLSSRTAQFASLVTIVSYIFLNFKLKGSIRKAFTGAASVATIIFLLFFVISGSRNRFNSPVAENQIIQEQQSSSTIQSNVRFTVWENVLRLYKQHPFFGVGTGDIKDELLKQYNKSGFTEGIQYDLSPHNQFLHTLLLLGIPGFLTLAVIFFYGLKKSMRYKNYLFALFLIAVAINCMTEGILEKQAGVLFFVFFTVLFSTKMKISSVSE